MQTLHVITPLSRPKNLPLLASNLEECLNLVETLIIKWVVVFDLNLKNEFEEIETLMYEGETHERLLIDCILSPVENALAGHAHRNIGLKHLERLHLDYHGNDWVYFLDDDNFLSSTIPEFLAQSDSNAHAILVDQYTVKDDSMTLRLKADKDNIAVCHVDMAQVCFQLKVLNELRFIETDYCADGHFIVALSESKNVNFFFPSDNYHVRCYYNYISDNFVEVDVEIEQEVKEKENCPVLLLQDEWEFKTLLRLFREHNPKNILEIGSFYGGTLWHWIQNSTNLKKIVSIDYPVPPSDGRYKEMILSRSQWNSWIPDNVMFFDIQGDSTAKTTIERAKVCNPNNDVDFLFIDGGHDYNTVKSDFENYSPLVRPGGMIVFHDVIGLEEVRKYWNELKLQQYRYFELCSNSNVGWGIGIIYK